MKIQGGDSFWVGSGFDRLVNRVLLPDLHATPHFNRKGRTVVHDDFYYPTRSFTNIFRALKSDLKNIQKE